MNKILTTAQNEKIDDEEFKPEAPRVPRPVDGYVIYTQVALDFESRFKLGEVRQTALNRAMAKAIERGELRTYDVRHGLPNEYGVTSPYVRPDEVNAWLKSIGYPLKWDRGGAPGAEDRNHGSGTEKVWGDAEIEKLITRRAELQNQGNRAWAAEAATEFNISSRRASSLIKNYTERMAKRKDPSKWGK